MSLPEVAGQLLERGEARVRRRAAADLANGPVGDAGGVGDLAERVAVLHFFEPGADLFERHSPNDAGFPTPLQAGIPTLSDERQSGHYLKAMAERKIFADNLRALMKHAAEGGQSLGTNLGLAKASGVSRTQIIAYLAEDQAPAIDMVGRIARAFGLQAWQLLVPNISATNPPVIHITDEERRLYRRLLYVQREFQGELSRAAPVSEPDGADRHRPRKRSSKSHK